MHLFRSRRSLALCLLIGVCASLHLLRSIADATSYEYVDLDESESFTVSSSSPTFRFPSLHAAQYQHIHLHAGPISVAQEADMQSMKEHRASSSSNRAMRPLSSHPSHSPSHPLVGAVDALPQSFPHRTYVLRVKAPFTTVKREALASYLHPYTLGAYVPHHAFLVSVGDAASTNATHADFRLESHALGRGSDAAAALLSHATARFTSEETETWLRAAPGVVFVSPLQPHHAIHPKLTAAIDKAHARNQRRVMRADAAKHDGMEEVAYEEEEEQDWNFADFERDSMTRARQRVSSRRDDDTADTDDQSDSARTFDIVSLRVSLTPHPLSRHSPKHLVATSAASSSSGSGVHDEHASHLLAESESLSHTESVLQHWRDQLEGLDLVSVEAAPTDDADAAWLRESDHSAARLNIGVSRFDHASPRHHTSDVHASLRTPHHAHLTVVTPTLVAVEVSAWFLPLVLRFLATRSEVTWVEPHVSPSTQNKFIRGIVQADRGNATPAWEHGVRGAGQVVQLGDTGLDADSCFFADPTRNLPVNTIDKEHRKIVTYQLFENADAGDDESGHGTHVGGSLAGSVLTSTESDATEHPLAQFNGMAPDAKIAFFDFKRSGADALLVPLSVYKPYLGLAYASTDARISSNSWGSPDGEYGSYCRELDQFAHDFPDSLVVFAAGNYGETGWNSVSSPGVAKNVLTVGSTKTSAASFFDAGLDWGIEVTGLGANSVEDEPTRFSVAESNFGLDFAKLDLKDARLLLADPLDACAPLVNTPEALANAPVVLVRRGTCHFGAKALAVQAASSSVKLVLVVNTEEGPAARMAADPGQAPVNLAVVMLTKSVGESLIAAVTAEAAADTAAKAANAASIATNTTDGNSTSGASTPTTSPVRLTAPVEVDPPDENESVLSSFSSRGPTFGGRLKPDVLAPGEFVRSVRSDGNPHSSDTCPSDLSKGLLQLEGTSMATPMVSAAAAMLRQYLTEGYYPLGRAVVANALTPSAALLKAMLVHSAVSSSGAVLTKKRGDAIARPLAVEPAPSYFQGYGRVLLENVMRFAANDSTTAADEEHDSLSPLMSTTLPNVALLDQEPPLESDELHSFCFLVSPNGAPLNASTNSSGGGLPFFRATLVWTDAPAAAGASFVLVNNLDLFVAMPSVGRVVLGNALAFTDSSNEEHRSWDTENNVEQVNVPRAPLAADLTRPLPILVHVRGTHAPSGPQRYALVVSGWFNDSIGDESSAKESRIKSLPVGRCLDFADGPDAPSAPDTTGVLCPDNCGARQERGNCSYTTGRCTCRGEWIGDDCSQLPFAPKQTGSLKWEHSAVTVPSDGWAFFSLPLSAIASVAGGKDFSRLKTLRVRLVRESTIGDPDLYVSIGVGPEFPSLRTHDFADTQCDSCVTGQVTSSDDDGVTTIGQPSTVKITPAKLLTLVSSSDVSRSDARLRIGVHGYCCDASTVSLVVSVKLSSGSRSIWRWLGPVLGSVAGLLLVVFIALLFRAHRRRRRTKAGLDRLPLPARASDTDIEADTSAHDESEPASEAETEADVEVELTSVPTAATVGASTPSSSSSSSRPLRILRSTPLSRAVAAAAARGGKFLPLSKDEFGRGDAHRPHSPELP